MPTKIRLQRHGKKRSAFFHIVIADNRAPRDGRFIEKIGTYNPNTNPATIDLEFEKALSWLKTGAQPTDTVRAILSYEGVLYRNHLDIGVQKGALTEADADKRYEAWKKEKLDKIQKKRDTLEKASSDAMKARHQSEVEVSKKREQEIMAKTSAMAEEAARANAEASAEAPASEEAVADVAADEAPAAEAAVETATEESVSEAPAAEVAAETASEESVSEAPVAEASAEAAEESTEESKEDEASEEEKA